MADVAFSDVRAHDRAISSSIRDVVTELVGLLGPTVVASIGGVNETRAVAQWTADRKPQRPDVLRLALQLALMVASDRDPGVVRSWFLGTNPRLDDRSPAQLLRNLPLEEIQAPLMAAARAFAAREPNEHPRENSRL